MRILLIAPYLPPYNNPRANRWGAIVGAWIKEGHEVDIISGKHPEIQADEKEDNLQIFRPGFPSLADRRRGNLDQSKNQLKPLRWLYRILFKSWQWPDQSWGWINPATEKTVQLTRNNTYDLLISVSLPFSAHLVARKVKEKNPYLNWVADIGDPFSLQKTHALNNRFLYQQKNLKEELDLIMAADKLVVTSPETKGIYLEHFGLKFKNKIAVIPPLSDFTVNSDRISKSEKYSIIKIGYFGRFFPGVRDAKDFIFAIKKIDALISVEFHFYGDTSGLLAASPDYTIHPQLSKEQLPKAIEQMDILLSLGNATNYQLPSKTVDYLCSGKPILHLAQLKEDAVITLTKNHAGVFSIQNTALDNPPTDLINFIKSAADKSFYERDVTPFRPIEIARKYLLISGENN